MNRRLLFLALVMPLALGGLASAKSVHPAQQQQQIACTKLGCITLPTDCYPIPGRTFGGSPTGYDVAICPPGTWPVK